MPVDVAKFQAIVEEQQRALQNIVNHLGVGPVKRVYESLLSEVTAKLRVAAAGSFDMVRAQGTLAQLQMGMARFVRQSAGVMGDAAFKVGITSARNMLNTAAALEAQLGADVVLPLPIMQIGRLHGLVKDRTSSILRLHETSMSRYSASVVETFEQQIAAGIATGETHHQIIDRVQRAGDLRWAGAERIVRTELSAVSNGVARDVADAQADELGGDMWTQWSEHVEGGVKLDDRVGVDSLAMHGQVAAPGGVFVQPPTAPRGGKPVSPSLVGEEWSHPPNRPNDRAVLTPWRVHWGIPGWVWRDGRRVRVTAAMVAKVNGKPSKPKTAPPAQATPAPETATMRAEAIAEASEAPIWTGPKKNPNLHPDLHVVWDQEGHKFMRQEGRRIKGIKDPINAASKISEAFAETYGSGEASTFGNVGDRFDKRQELVANRAETRADELESAHYAEMQRDALADGMIDENGEPTKQGIAREGHVLEEVDDWGEPISRAPKPSGDDPPF